MEHRHHRQHAVGRAQPEHVRRVERIGVQHAERWLYSTPFGRPVVPEV